ncbi:metallophosphoesterase [Stakelama tenebrarum]|uniref:Phosphohydrolase n=1 Tax=Stakelama tenebrarum TaxID=2711215 RepID=A0A6G6Y0J7_9SPHN|nr:metallophosphoesterase [Sphingosinithalassobacter tenebrarum]QIG78429.1 phosphohydrolase [Sphingosinithalassobacter tenebrarum]
MRRLLALLLLVPLVLAALGYANAVSVPEMRQTRIAMRDWPADAAPIRVALLSDIHVQGPDMPPRRLARIVAQVNAAQPDLVLLAGDFVGDRFLRTKDYTAAEMTAPLANLSAPLGVYAVLGNHDHWHDAETATDTIRAALRDARITLLDNDVVQAGPLLLAGAGDSMTDHADVPRIVRQAMRRPGPILAFAHSPDVVPDLPPRFRTVLAGHTHCGQIVLPALGAIVIPSRYGDRFACGVRREGDRSIVVSSGLGTSIVPIRFGAPPDWWLITLGPADAAKR